MVENDTRSRVFELTGGRLCLDFANTVEDRPGDAPRDLLESYDDLVDWGQQAHILTEGQAQRLLAGAASHPVEAAEALRRAITVREAIYRIFRARAEEATPAEEDLRTFNAALADAMAHACLMQQDGGFAWDWSEEDGNLERVLWPVVRSAADILTSDELDDVRVCASEDCEWLFIDTSKNHSRRWCDMQTCGNRAKARRHYKRKKGDSLQ